MVLVLGDSTGTLHGNWVQRVSRAWGDAHGRPVLYHEWSVERQPDAYEPMRRLGPGDRAPIVVWNGSAAAEAAAYSLSTFDDVAPLEGPRPDLVFISHGHNQPPGTLVVDGGALLDRVEELSPSAAVVVLTQNPEAEDGPNAAGQAAEVAAFADLARQRHLTVVDVRAAFEEQGDLGAFLDELGVHPNDRGDLLWAQTVLDALGT